jgi:uncharacterized protein YndB with AHSA1/START domain
MKLVNTELDADQTVVWIEWSTTADCGHLFWAFTDGISDWLGDPSSMTTAAEPGVAFCIDARREWGGDAHYGRFVELHQDRRIVMKWIAESLGGVEADIVIELVPTARGTHVSIAHAGVSDPAVRATVGGWWNGARHAIDSLIFSSQPPT